MSLPSATAAVRTRVTDPSPGVPPLLAVEDLVRPYAVDGVLDLPVPAELAWGRITVTAGR